MSRNGRARLLLGAASGSPTSPSTTPHPYPKPSTLRRLAPWQSRPPHTGHDVRRLVAVHEAGHVVLMRWIGLESPAATIHADDAGTRGEAHWPDRQFFAQLPDPTPDETGILAATAASVFHAGVVAEQIESGAPWAGPIHYAYATDYQRADDMLRPAFGCHASGVHGYAQQVALHVLQVRWDAVDVVAAELLRYGRWRA